MLWQLLPTISASMPFQMALDALLFEKQTLESQPPVLRFYNVSDPWISVGYSFRGAEDLQKSALILGSPQVPVCRRVTGGGCVLHGADLIFSLIARYDSENDPLNSVRTSYGKLHEGVKMALERFGLEPGFFSLHDDLPHGDDCFRFPVANDISWKGRKIAGGAQKRSHGVLLHQESVQKPRSVGQDALSRAICDGLVSVLKVNIQAVDLDPDLFFQAERKAALQDWQPWKNSEII